MQMQTYGSPPPEIMGTLPPGFDGLDKLGGPGQEGCVISWFFKNPFGSYDFHLFWLALRKTWKEIINSNCVTHPCFWIIKSEIDDQPQTSKKHSARVSKSFVWVDYTDNRQPSATKDILSFHFFHPSHCSHLENQSFRQIIWIIAPRCVETM